MEREKVIKELGSLRDICNAKSNMAIGMGKVAWAGYANTADDAIALLKAQDEIISELLKVGYPHGYENEEPWIVDYMQLITEVVRKAVHLRNGTE